MTLKIIVFSTWLLQISLMRKIVLLKTFGTHYSILQAVRHPIKCKLCQDFVLWQCSCIPLDVKVSQLRLDKLFIFFKRTFLLTSASIVSNQVALQVIDLVYVLHKKPAHERKLFFLTLSLIQPCHCYFLAKSS